MKAIVQDRYGPPDVLHLEDIEEPIATADEVLVRVLAASAFIGDWHVATGVPYAIRAVSGVRAPKNRVRGQDFAGRVESVGANVTGLHPGDEVFGTCMGSFAEMARAEPGKIAPKPANLDFKRSATVPTTGSTALQGLRDVGRVQPGQRVLIIGAAGAVGSFAVQLAKAFGATVTGVASTGQLELVRALGADDVIDYTRADVTDGTRQWDLIIDTAGRRSLSALRRALPPDGTLVIVGGEGGGRLMGGFLRNLRAPLMSRFVSQRLQMLASKERQDDLQTLRELLEAGKLVPDVGPSYPLDEVPEAMRQLVEGHTQGKIVITV